MKKNLILPLFLTFFYSIGLSQIPCCDSSIECCKVVCCESTAPLTIYFGPISNSGPCEDNDLTNPCGVHFQNYSERCQTPECLDEGINHGILNSTNKFSSVVGTDDNATECFSATLDEIQSTIFNDNYVLTATVEMPVGHGCPDYPQTHTFDGKCFDHWTIFVPQTGDVAFGDPSMTVTYRFYETCKECTEDEDGNKIGNVRPIYEQQFNFGFGLTEFGRDKTLSLAYTDTFLECN